MLRLVTLALVAGEASAFLPARAQPKVILGFGKKTGGDKASSPAVVSVVPAAGKVVADLSGGPLQTAVKDGVVTFKKKATSSQELATQKKFADKWNFGSAADTHIEKDKGIPGGVFGGRFIPETLMVAHKELEAAWNKWKSDPEFKAELATLRRDFVGGPTPLYHAKRLSEQCGGAQIWMKREELAHTGAHKINNAIGQALLAMKLGKKRKRAALV